jgi:spermidine synthase
VPGAAVGRLVTCVESRYQHLEVRERDDLPVPARVLALDEGLDSYQSVAPAQGSLTGGLYYDVFTMLALERCSAGRLRVLVLGMGGGTHVRQLLEFVGPRCELSIVGVEIDPEVVAIGRTDLGLPDDPRVTVITDVDARPFAERCRGTFDFVIVDCYARQSFLPSHVVSREFFAAVRRLLAPEGEVALNLFGYGGRDPVVETVVRGVVSEFPEGAVVARVPRTANFVVYARRDQAASLPAAWKVDGWPEPLQALARAMSSPGAAWIAAPDPGVPPLRDDDGQLELLQWRRLADHAQTLRASVR